VLLDSSMIMTMMGCQSLRKSVISGMTAGAFGQFFSSPTDLVKVQMQMEGKRVLVDKRKPRYSSIYSQYFTLSSSQSFIHYSLFHS
jgi:solute carrier family 25 uncoupling protein 27